MSHNSLKYQFKKQLIISVGLLVLIFSFLLYQILFIGIGASMHRGMMSMTDHYAQQLEADPSFPLPHNDDFSIYVGRETLPAEIEQMFDIDTLPPFSFSVHDDSKLSELFRPQKITFLETRPLKNNKGILYLVYHDRDPQRAPPPRHGKIPSHLFLQDHPPQHAEKVLPPGPPPKTPLINVPNSIIFIILLATLLVYWIVQRLITSVLNPLNELALMAKSLDENNPELSFSVMQNKTEIGAVAKTLHQTMQRIHQYHQREKQFLQNASHELRTPIAVISSALDIIDLRASQGNHDIADQHINIRRANKNMTEMTSALLLLSDKNRSIRSLDTIDLKQLSTSIIEEHKYLLKDKRVFIDLIGADNETHELPGTLCRIVLSNLIRNAFEQTLSGGVSVDISGRKVLVTNTSSAIYNNEEGEIELEKNYDKGFGIGLDIVKKIVEQQQWQLHFFADVKKGWQVVINFENKTLSDKQ
ncbi:two-component sensor histidine kinase [Psychromonas marina]|uniref:histidine kinase n=1 Tax=Psychromonas marina TaxID=88364 RepID=A0ABQ6E1J5_9GAMM|nr:HAMP domain-containing sensor histidine kinase [Psychromonas marina]GLS91119.1 two-component sensor histidine kinase [Psychromonas marina]